MSSIARFMYRWVYVRPTRASEKISYSPPTTNSSEDCAVMSGSTGTLSPPVRPQMLFGLLAVLLKAGLPAGRSSSVVQPALLGAKNGSQPLGLALVEV